MAIEATITASILKYLNSLPNCVAEKVFGNAQQIGRPDINGCWNGRCFRLEVKSPDHGNQPTKIQELNLKTWSRAGAYCFTVYSLEDVKAIINKESEFHKERFKGRCY